MKKIYVCRYRPGYFSGFEGTKEEEECFVNSLEELMNIPWVKSWKDNLSSEEYDLIQYSWAHGGIRGPSQDAKYGLMAELQNGESWHVAGIDDTFGLPEWNYTVCKERKKEFLESRS